MGKYLIIVESPTKIKTLKKILGTKYHFESSLGHIRDLPTKGFGIDIENNFEPEYTTLPEKKDLIKKLKDAAKDASIVYLAPDPDREGEAIAWHIASILPKSTKIKRISFNAITKLAVEEALKHPREIDQTLVDAQQARRLLDRMVGYKISPILQRKIQKGRDGFLSAGRVQSVALKLVVEREKEIDAFIPKEYWTIAALLKPSKKDPFFSAFLHSVGGKKIVKEVADPQKEIAISNKTSAEALVTKLKQATYEVASVEKKEKKRNPVPPFITSSLQQEASRHYGFSATRTMKIAQALYEGVELGKRGIEGLITYMRTDSTRIDPEAQKEARAFLQKRYGKAFIPDEPKTYAAKASAQDAHECIRPTDSTLTPEDLRQYLSPDEYKIYLLIWRRFLASQMNPAIYDTVSCDIATDKDMVLRATGSIIKFQGFLILYHELEDKEEKNHKEEESSEDTDRILPPLKEEQPLHLEKVKSDQSFTKAPPRYTEASLVKALEKCGIGRPSTYATIMNKIQSREYTTKEKQALKPTELGKVICQMLDDNFAMIMDIGFTASMEDELDKIAEDKIDWKKFLKKFWDKFFPLVEVAEKEAFVPKILTELDCPQCGAKLQKIWSRNKYFYGCSNYPECKFTTPMEALDFNKADYADNFDWDQSCPKCGKSMTLRHGRYGAFLGCSDYPNCKGIVNIPKKGEALPEEMPNCPAIGCPGKLTPKRSRFGKIFYSCSTYPECDVIGNSLEEIETKYSDHPRTASQKKPKKTTASSKKTASTTKEPKKKTRAAPKQPSYKVSKELQEIIKVDEITRPELTKKVWEYIKKHNLQDPKNKRLIVPDKKLAKVFGSSASIDMMKLAAKLGKHLS
ncbi:MAG: type I DNA topoisomerase [Chlamydiae bacterium]|nr:type I DNA topoisomerase [Chlamydiota bacterium]